MESPEQTESRRRRDGKERGQRSESLHDPKPDSLYAHFGLVCFALIDDTGTVADPFVGPIRYRSWDL